MQKALDILKEFQAEKGAKVALKKVARIEKRPGVEEIKVKESPNILKGSLHESVSDEKVEKISQKMFEKKIYCDLEVPLPLGGPFSNYGEIDNVFDEGKTELAHKPGEVLLVDVWATWCPPCQKPMAHNQEMLQKNAQAWKDRVRIVGVSVDQDKGVIKQRVDSKKWHNVVHLTLLGWKGDHSLIKDFKVQGIPFVCLIDKFGKINYAGHPMGINIETRINQLLALENQQSSTAAQASKSAAPEPSLSKEEVQKILIEFQKDKLQNAFKDLSLCCMTYERTQSWEGQNIKTKLEVKATTIQGDQDAVQKLNSFFGQFKGIDVKIETAKYINVPYEDNQKCWKCSAALNFPYYWLKWEEGNKFGCRECVEAKSTEEGHHFAYEKNSILLLGKWDKIAENNMGKNIQPADIKSVTEGHGYGCNACGGCSGEVGDARYICLGCRAAPNYNRDYCDLCVPCTQKLIKGNAQVLQSLKPDYHVPSHPFLRVLYSAGDYYTF